METKVCLPKNSGDVKSLKQSDTGNAVCACADLSEITGVCLYETRCEKTGLRDFRPGPTQTGLYSHRRC